jgi:hypothetical protein
MALAMKCPKGHSYVAPDISRLGPFLQGEPACPECAEGWRAARTMEPVAVCSCEEWGENLPKINGAFLVASLHVGSYDLEPFQFCPYCGNPREVPEAKETPKEKVRSLHARAMTRNYHLWYRRTCIRCGKPFMFQSHPDGSWIRQCIECGHIEDGTGFDDGQGCPCCGRVALRRRPSGDGARISCPECGYWVLESIGTEKVEPAGSVIAREGAQWRGQLAATRRTCPAPSCGQPVGFESESNGNWRRICVECGYTERGFGFDESGCPCCGETYRDITMDRSHKKTKCPECGYWVVDFVDIGQADAEEAAADSKETCCGTENAACCV